MTAKFSNLKKNMDQKRRTKHAKWLGDVEAKKKMDALIELKDRDRKWRETQYKIIQIPFNSAFDTPKKTA